MTFRFFVHVEGKWRAVGIVLFVNIWIYWQAMNHGIHQGLILHPKRVWWCRTICMWSLWAMGITHIHTGSLRGYGLYYISFVRSSRIFFTHGDRGWQASSSQIAKFMGPTWGQPGSCRSQMGPMLAPWTLLSGMCFQKAIFLALHHSLAITQPFLSGFHITQ